MSFLLNSQAQGVSGKNAQSNQTTWHGGQCSCIGLRPALQVEKCCSSKNRSKTRFKLAWTLTFTVISSRKFQTWFFLNASASHMWPAGR